MIMFANASRGLRINGTNFRYFTEGAYGAIFVDDKLRRIRKLYFHRGEDDIAHRRDVFAAEIGAYAVASKHPELSALTPSYFGVCGTQEIVDCANSDVTNEFCDGLAFEAEFVPCEFFKIGDARIPAAEYQRVTTLFRSFGIAHVTDMSVCLRHEKIHKVIDFATQEYEPEHKPIF